MAIPQTTGDQNNSHERGAALVEFALLLPLLLVLVFGIIEFGGTYNNSISLRNGVREGARLAVVNNVSPSGSCSGDATTVLVCQTKARIGLNPNTTKVSITVPSGAKIGDTVTVCASSPTYKITGIMTPFLGDSVTAAVTMRLEQVPSFTSYADAGAPSC